MNETAPDSRRYLGMAAAIGDALCREALWEGERCNWGGAAMEPVDGEWRAVWSTLGPTVYDGTAGVAIFLSRLHARTRDPKHAVQAVAAMRQALASASHLPPSSALSFYAGALGVAYAAEMTARLCGRPDMAGEAARLVGIVAETDPAEAESDVIAGLAGAIPALLALEPRNRRGPDLRGLAIRSGEALIAKARRHQDGSWSWPAIAGQAEQTPNAGVDLVGYSHGTAGIACAFLELWKETGDERFRDAAARAHRYERRWYDAGQRNWPDLRSEGTSEEPSAYPVYWCHGAVGIAFARLRGYALTGDADLLAEAEIALETTARHVATLIDPSARSGFEHNFSLCHGLAGSGELFLYAAEALPAKAQEWRAQACAVAEWGIARHGAAGPQAPGPWPCGIIGGSEAPGLLLGTSGIGHFYLRLADPETPTPLIVHPTKD